MRGLTIGGLVALAGLTACSTQPVDSGAEGLTPLTMGTPVRVLEVLAVDTLGVDLNGNGSFDPERETVRLIGVSGVASTAEQTEYPAPAAIAYLTRMLVDNPDQKVIVDDDRKELGLFRQDPPPEFDVTDTWAETEPGGPWLAYVLVGDICVNRELIAHGYGTVRAAVPFAREAEFRDVEARARRAKVGLWETR